MRLALGLSRPTFVVLLAGLVTALGCRQQAGPGAGEGKETTQITIAVSGMN